MNTETQLGCIGEDTITGFIGVITGRTEWLFGCTRFCLEPQELREGIPIEAQWFDEQRVEIISDKQSPVRDALQKISEAVETIGGPQNDPSRRKDLG